MKPRSLTKQQGRRAAADWAPDRHALHDARLEAPDELHEVLAWRERYGSAGGADDAYYLEVAARVAQACARMIGHKINPLARALTYGRETVSLADVPKLDHAELRDTAAYLRSLADAVDFLRTGTPTGKVGKSRDNASTHALALAWYLYTGGALDVFALALDEEASEAELEGSTIEAVASPVALQPRADVRALRDWEETDADARFAPWTADEIEALLGATVVSMLRRERANGSRAYVARHDSLARFRGHWTVIAQSTAVDILAVADHIVRAVLARELAKRPRFDED